MVPDNIVCESDKMEIPGALPEEVRKRRIERCIESLAHASRCRNSNCRLLSCQEMKGVISHNKACKNKKTCASCRRLVATSCYHAKRCQVNDCTLPFCQSIKMRIKRNELQALQLQAD